MYRVFSGGFSVTKVKCYVSVQVTYLLDKMILGLRFFSGLFTFSVLLYFKPGQVLKVKNRFFRCIF